MIDGDFRSRAATASGRPRCSPGDDVRLVGAANCVTSYGHTADSFVTRRPEPPGHQVAPYTRVSGTSRTNVRTTPAPASAARAAVKPSVTARLVITGTVRAALRRAPGRSGGTVTCSRGQVLSPRASCRTLGGMADVRGAVMAWSAGVSAAGAALAAVFAGRPAVWQRALFIALVVIAIAAFVILLGAGLQGLFAGLRAGRSRQVIRGQSVVEAVPEPPPPAGAQAPVAAPGDASHGQVWVQEIVAREHGAGFRRSGRGRHCASGGIRWAATCPAAFS